MNREKLYELLEEIMCKIDTNPGCNLSTLSKALEEYGLTKELQLAVKGLRDSLGVIRLSLKYLLLDLEATRRERDTLRMILEDKEQ